MLIVLLWIGSTLTSTALSRTTCETDSHNCAAIPGLFKPRVNLRSAISPIIKTKEIIKNTTMQSKNIHSIVSVAWVAPCTTHFHSSGVHAMCVSVLAAVYASQIVENKCQKLRTKRNEKWLELKIKLITLLCRYTNLEFVDFVTISLK